MPRVNIRGNMENKNSSATLKRLLKILFKTNKKRLILVGICLIISAIVTSGVSIYIINMLQSLLSSGNAHDEIMKSLIIGVGVMGIIYFFGIMANIIYPRIMAYVTQDFLAKLREDLFNKMQDLPIRFFDNNQRGDLMSMYTNDVDAIRQLVSQSLPQVFLSSIMVIVIFFVMVTYSIWLTLIVLACVILMLFIVSKVSKKSAKYFIEQQKSIGKVEGFIEEMIHGQKVVKVFNHENDTKIKFDELNENYFKNSSKANTYANILMPMLGNIGNIMYVLVAFVGSLMVIKGGFNVGLSGISKEAVTLIPIVVGFLTMGRQFSVQVSQVSQQINAVIMALAGAERIFKVLDETPEQDEGYVTLVNAKYDENGQLTESTERTNIWAWKHPHKAEGTITYQRLKGDIEMVDVDFAYVEGKTVLFDVSLHAKPGEKFAFVGSTGAGKTTITNLINRFYDIEDGKIRYDGININKIKKSDLRKSLGVVLQDTNLFTGTIRENIRYGRLEATDEEVIEAAKIANADDFITRLPDGYDTMLTNNGTNLSQGQRQLISIARAAVANTPAMILDEATSSIDTRTEAIVQRGTDQLMKGRTVFVIAHRLSTVRNSDTILVLDHGRVIEEGTHDELIAQKGAYYKLYTGAVELD